MLTTPEEAGDTGVGFLAPVFGGIHGEHGPRGPQLDYPRLESIRKFAAGKVRIVLHGANDFSEEAMRGGIKRGVSKINIDKSVLHDYLEHLKASANGCVLFSWQGMSIAWAYFMLIN